MISSPSPLPKAAGEVTRHVRLIYAKQAPEALDTKGPRITFRQLAFPGGLQVELRLPCI